MALKEIKPTLSSEMCFISKVSFSVLTFLLLILLVGCASRDAPDSYVSAVAIVKEVQTIQVDTREKNFNLLYGNDPALESAFRQYTKTGKAPNIITDGFVRFAYNPGQMPIVKTVPFQETVISLEPGEKFTNISSGDPSRWSYAMAVSGTGSSQQQNILICHAHRKLNVGVRSIVKDSKG